MFGFKADKFLNKYCTKIVRFDKKYAVRRRHWFRYPLGLYEDEYLDLKSMEHQLRKKSLAEESIIDPAKKLHWWNSPNTINSYCLSEDLEYVLKMMYAVRGYQPPAEYELPKEEVVKDIRLELAQYKLSK